jgi:NAD(P)-dependent dehydrogenase (short-subunit alcohol dehydrogenase family)
MPRFDPHPARRPTLIAGASSGIGAATAIELAARGFPVALGARRVDKCEELAARIRADGGDAVAHAHSSALPPPSRVVSHAAQAEADTGWPPRSSSAGSRDIHARVAAAADEDE